MIPQAQISIFGSEAQDVEQIVSLLVLLITYSLFFVITSGVQYIIVPAVIISPSTLENNPEIPKSMILIEKGLF